MIIFLYGEYSYRISQKLSELVSGYRIKNPSGLNFTSFDFLGNSLKDFEDNLTNNSLILEKKLIILKNFTKADPENLLELIKSHNVSRREDTILVVVSFSDFKNKLFEYLIKKPNQSQNFRPLKIYEIKNWVKKFANSLNIELAGDATDFLVLHSNNNLWQLDNEVRKIAAYKVEGVVTRSQVEELVIPNPAHNTFDLTNALANKNKAKALRALYMALENNEKPTELLGMLAWQVRNIIQFKLDHKSLKLHPFVLEKLKESAGLFSLHELKKILLKIVNLDLAFKTTDINEKTALSLLISEL